MSMGGKKYIKKSIYDLCPKQAALLCPASWFLVKSEAISSRNELFLFISSSQNLYWVKGTKFRAKLQVVWPMCFVLFITSL